MKNTTEIIFGLATLSLMGLVLWHMILSSSIESDPSVVIPPSENIIVNTSDFRFALEEQVRIEIGQPIEGFEPVMFMQVFPGLLPEDFDGVEAMIGVYEYKGGELNHNLGNVDIVHSAAPAVAESGINTLFNNVSQRLEIRSGETAVDEIVLLLKEESIETLPSTSAKKNIVTASIIYPKDNELITTLRYNPERINLENDQKNVIWEADEVLEGCEYRVELIGHGETSLLGQGVITNHDKLDTIKINSVYNTVKYWYSGTYKLMLSVDCVSDQDFVSEYGDEIYVEYEYRTGVDEDSVICTMDAKICPDGSAVGRGGSNCEFDECPGPVEKGGVIQCSSDFNEGDACVDVYQPVCGLVDVQCITTPCNPVLETFSNSCSACSQGNVSSYTEGACSTIN